MATRSPKFILWRSKSTGRYCFKLCAGGGKPRVYSNQYRSLRSIVRRGDSNLPSNPDLCDSGVVNARDLRPRNLAVRAADGEAVWR
jgi:hypothetical protein